MVYYIDIDGTLTDEPNQPWGSPVWRHIERIQLLVRTGHRVYLWSANGEKYAADFAKKYGIVAVCLPKPDVCVDDKPLLRADGKLKVMSPWEFFGA